MSRKSKTITFALITIIATTIIIIKNPHILIYISRITNLTDAQISNFLAVIDIILTIIFFIYSNINQKKEGQACQYEFSIDKDGLSFDDYTRFPRSNDVYDYVYNREDDISRPYHALDVHFGDKEIAGVGIPLVIKVNTNLSGGKLVLSNLQAYIKNCTYSAKNILPIPKLVIESPINNGKKFLIRIKLLCDHQLEQEFLDSSVYLVFKIILTDNKKTKHKQYCFLNVQNIKLGESHILSSTIEYNWISYIITLLKLKWQFK